MHSRKIWSLLLLFAISFSVMHELTIASLDENHCSLSEYIEELSESTEHGDVCDSHYKYHASYILSTTARLIFSKEITSAITSPSIHYTFDSLLTLFKPPITA